MQGANSIRQQANGRARESECDVRTEAGSRGREVGENNADPIQDNGHDRSRGARYRRAGLRAGGPGRRTQDHGADDSAGSPGPGADSPGRSAGADGPARPIRPAERAASGCPEPEGLTPGTIGECRRAGPAAEHGEPKSGGEQPDGSPECLRPAVARVGPER